MSGLIMSNSNVVSNSPTAPVGVTDTNKVQNSGDDQNNDINSDILDIGNFIAQMQAIIMKLRNILRQYNEKQQELGWSVLTTSIKNKLDAIDNTKTAGIISGVLQIGGGVLAGTGIGVGATTGLGDIASHSGQVLEKIAVGSSQIAASTVTRDAEIFKTQAELQSQNAQAYNGNLGKTLESAQEIMRRLVDDSKALMNSLGQILSAVKMT